MNAHTAAGAGSGMAGGVVIGSLFGPADVATLPTAAAAGYIGGAALGRVGGLISCMSGPGAGGGDGPGQAASGASEATHDTPKSHPEKFRAIRGKSAKLNINTGEVWVKDPSQHGGEHYEVYRNQRDFANGVRDRQVWADGRVGRSY